jgi:hypothetical protein
LYESIYAPQVDEELELSDEELSEAVEDAVSELIEEGYDIDDIEDVFDDELIEEILDEAKFSSKDVKMAIGIASDPRYKGGNMTGAVKAIDKIKKCLSDHPQVSAVLKRQNEDINEMRDFVSETAEMMMRDMVIMSKKIDELMEAMEAEMARPQMDEFDIEPWIVSKVTKAKDYIDSVYDYAVLDNDEDID